jgi:hypothetical protein
VSVEYSTWTVVRSPLGLSQKGRVARYAPTLVASRGVTNGAGIAAVWKLPAAAVALPAAFCTTTR